MNLNGNATPAALGDWQDVLQHAVSSPEMEHLARHLEERRAQGAVIYPPEDEVYSALSLLPPNRVKAVILGQDPYHRQGQAHGLAFSVRHGVDVPPSLRSIYKELESDLGIRPPNHGNLEKWAREGVLLLNTLLTVEEGTPMAHKGRGWEVFTDAVIRAVSAHSHPSVFILWGNPSRKKSHLIDSQRHRILESAHPSPLSANRGFFGSRPFSRTNEWLIGVGRDPIDWALE